MYRQTIANNIGFPLQDITTGTRIPETLVFLSESQYWDETRMREYRIHKLKLIIDHAYKNVPYYREAFDKTKLKPSDINDLTDLYKIPVVTRENFGSRNTDFIARGVKSRHIKAGKTGGTTGSPVNVLKDASDRTLTWASYYRWYSWMGISMGEKSLTFWGARNVTGNNVYENIKQRVINCLQNTVVINSFNITRGHLPSVIDKINKTKPVLIKGYLSSLLFLADYMKENKVRLSFPLKALSSTTETLLPNNRKMLEEIFRVPVFDQYGCGEVSGIAYECSHHKGMHLTQEHVIAETLDDTGNPVIKEGNVVITNLDNFIMPFIRYANGDVATLSETRCSCGVTLPLMVSVDGRASDVIILKNDARVHGVFFTDILYEKGIFTDRIQRFQVFQEKPGEIEFRIESSKVIDTETDNLLYTTMSKYFNRVEIVRSGRLENEPNGKFKYIKSCLC